MANTNSSVGQIIALVRLTPYQFQMGWRRGRIAQWLSIALAWLLLGGAVFLLFRDPLAVNDPSSVELRDSILSAAFMIGLILCIPLALFLFLTMYLPTKDRWMGSRTLRAAILAGECKQIPAVLDQPSPLAADEFPLDMKPFRPLKWLAGTSSFFPMLVGVMFVALAVWAAFSILEPAHTSGPGFHDMLQLATTVITLGRLLTLIGGPQLVTEGWGALLPSRRARLLAIDDLGIRWRARGWRTREQTLAWQDIAAFWVYRMKPTSGSNVFYVYVAMSDDLSFAWVQSQRAKAAARAASELLSRLIVTRARRPLLDATRSIETMDVWVEDPPKPADYAKHQNLFATRVEDEQEAHRPLLLQGELQGILSRSSARRAEAEEMTALHLATIRQNERSGISLQPIRLRARFYWLNVLLMLLVASSAVGMWRLDQHLLAEYYQTLPTHITAETPLFTDPLTSADNAWPVQSPTATDTSSYHYAYGGYAMTGGPQGYTNFATVEAQYDDVALAVTARQIGSSDNDGVGLVARNLSTNGSDSDQIVFSISPTAGYWDLYHYQPGHRNSDDNWQYLDGGNSSAIHTGANATNRFLLVLRGTEYLCYINGQFVGRDVDSTVTPSSPKFGYPGLYVNDDTTTGVFNDFAIYPAPPPYQRLLHGLGL